MDFTIRIAKKNILIHSVSPRVFHLCRDFLMDNNTVPDIEISVDDDMIVAESKRIQQSTLSGISLKTAEELLIHRLIAESLLHYDVILMHGAVVAVNDVCYMFTARSGTGKTTHIQKWLDKVPDSFVVNGDKPMIMLNRDGVFACGTPWCGKEGLGENTIVPLRSIILMERSADNFIEAIPFKYAFPILLAQTFQPIDVDKMKKTLEIITRLKDYVSFYKFHFNNLKQDSFQVSYEMLTKQQEG